VAHTFALLHVSAAAYAEIREKLVASGYNHTFDKTEGRECIDMHSLALVAEPPRKYRHYIFLSRPEPGWDPFRPTPIGALKEVYAWITNPSVMEIGAPPERRGTLTYRADHFEQLTSMMRRAIGWDPFEDAGR
jgi:hypothetical protein